MNNPARYIGNATLRKGNYMFINNDLSLTRKKNKNRFVGVAMLFITSTCCDRHEARIHHLQSHKGQLSDQKINA